MSFTGNRRSKKRPVVWSDDSCDDCDPPCKKNSDLSLIKEVVENRDLSKLEGVVQSREMLLKPELEFEDENDGSLVLCEPLCAEDGTDHLVHNIGHYVLDSVLLDDHELALEEFVEEVTNSNSNGVEYEDTDTLIDEVIFE
jgi:hypothetical protein